MQPRVSTAGRSCSNTWIGALCRAVLIFACFGVVVFSCPAAHAKTPTKLLEVRPTLGYSWVNLTGISQQKFLSAAASATPEQIATANEQTAIDAAKVPVEGNGPAAGLGLDLRLWIFSLGGQYMYTHAGDFGLHTIVANVGMRLGGTVGFYTRWGGGYAIQSGLPSGLSTRGYVISSSEGFDIRLSAPLSIGFGVDGELLLLTRDGQIQGQAQILSSGNVDAQSAAKFDGSAIGFQLRPVVHLTWHI